MHVSVEYLVEDDEYERLKHITEGYKKQGLDDNFIPENMFQSIMMTGSKYDKGDKFKFHEWKLGLREDWK